MEDVSLYHRSAPVCHFRGWQSQIWMIELLCLTFVGKPLAVHCPMHSQRLPKQEVCHGWTCSQAIHFSHFLNFTSLRLFGRFFLSDIFHMTQRLSFSAITQPIKGRKFPIQRIHHVTRYCHSGAKVWTSHERVGSWSRGRLDSDSSQGKRLVPGLQSIWCSHYNRM